MKTTDLFKINRTSKRLNESMFKTFGRKLNLETFNIEQLEDARNKLRTQIYTARNSSSFNETVENDALSKAQFMHDAIVAELAERDEPIVDNTQLEGRSPEVEEFLTKVAQSGDDGFDMLYDAQAGKYGKEIEQAVQEMYDDITIDTGYHGDDDFEQIYDRMLDNIEADYGDRGSDDEGGDTDDGYALASAGFGSDEDYGDFPESMGNSQYVVWYMVDDGQWDKKGKFNNEDDADAYIQQLAAKGYDDDNFEVLKPGQHPDDDYNYKTPEAMEERVRDPEDWDEGNTEPPNNFAVSINGKKWKVFKGRGQYADDQREQAHYQQLKDWAAKKSADTGKKWTVSITGENPTESIEQNNESINTGEDMRNLREGEIQQASAIVTAKTMVDRVGRWIEELSGMENDTLLQLGDSIRDEMGQEQAKGFIEAVAPAIQAALENLKTTREALATGVRTLTGEEQPANMLGGEPTADMAAEPDAMNTDAELGGDEFAAAEPAAGGAEEAGREMRESINHQNRLMRVLAG